MAWTILGFILILALYTLFIIKKEQKSFKQEAQSFSLKHYQLFVPRWWGVDVRAPENDFIRFKRVDTRYDWYAYFCWKNHSNSSLEKILQVHLDEQDIVFDEDRKMIKNSVELIKDPELLNSITEFYRIEGTATQAEEDRLYLDYCLIKDKRFDGYFFAESKSSVLNGLVEGPFFEETLKYLESL